jgi:hypothetical protein
MVDVRASDILLYVPNQIGYSRVLFTAVSIILMVSATEYWLLATGLYLASFVGDLFGQCSDSKAGSSRCQCYVVFVYLAVLHHPLFYH